VPIVLGGIGLVLGAWTIFRGKGRIGFGAFAAGGKDLACSGDMAPRASIEAPQNKPKVILGQRGFTKVILSIYAENDRRKITILFYGPASAASGADHQLAMSTGNR